MQSLNVFLDVARFVNKNCMILFLPKENFRYFWGICDELKKESDMIIISFQLGFLLISEINLNFQEPNNGIFQ